MRRRKCELCIRRKLRSLLAALSTELNRSIGDRCAKWPDGDRTFRRDVLDRSRERPSRPRRKRKLRQRRRPLTLADERMPDAELRIEVDGRTEREFAVAVVPRDRAAEAVDEEGGTRTDLEDRKSTRLNSSHVPISYAVSCMKKKK